MTARLDRATLVGLGLTAIAAVVYWISQPRLRGGPPRLLLPRRRVPPRPRLDGLRDRAQRRDRRGQQGLRAVRAVPGDRVHAARRDHRARSPPTTSRPGSTRSSPRDRSGWAGGCWAGSNVRSLVDRFWLVLLLGFSTQIWWITTRGGVWHTGQLIATLLTLGCLIEMSGQAAGVADRAARRRRVPVAGAARVRGPVLRAAPGRRPGLGAAPLAGRVVAEARAGRRAVGPVLLLVQRGALRVAVRVGLRARHRSAVPRGAARAGAVLDRATSR